MAQEPEKEIPPTKLWASVLPDQANVYVTILSIIQCIALGFWMNEAKDIFMVKQEEFDWPLTLRYYVALSIIFVVWHRYVGQIQYLWPISWWDTVFPFSMGIIECMIVFTTNPKKASLENFLFSIVMFQIMSSYGYFDAWFRRKRKITIRLYQDFYSGYPQFAKNLLNFLVNDSRSNLRRIQVYFILSLGLFILHRLYPLYLFEILFPIVFIIGIAQEEILHGFQGSLKKDPSIGHYFQ